MTIKQVVDIILGSSQVPSAAQLSARRQRPGQASFALSTDMAQLAREKPDTADERRTRPPSASHHHLLMPDYLIGAEDLQVVKDYLQQLGKQSNLSARPNIEWPVPLQEAIG